jgi:hypothetical protein
LREGGEGLKATGIVVVISLNGPVSPLRPFVSYIVPNFFTLTSSVL